MTKNYNETKYNGFYKNLDENLYHKDNAFGSTDIKTIIDRIDLFAYKREHPDENEGTSALSVGKALHNMVENNGDLEKFQESFFIGTVSAYKKEGGGSKTVIPATKTGFELVQKLYKSLEAKNYPFLGSDSTKELSYFWQCDGINKKCRFDIIGKEIINGVEHDIIYDLKTISSIDEIDNSIAKYNYYVQAMHYLEGLKDYKLSKGLKIGNEDFRFIFIEKSAPHAVVLTDFLADHFFESAEKRIEKAICKFKEAEKNNDFTEYKGLYEIKGTWKYESDNNNF